MNFRKKRAIELSPRLSLKGNRICTSFISANYAAGRHFTVPDDMGHLFSKRVNIGCATQPGCLRLARCRGARPIRSAEISKDNTWQRNGRFASCATNGPRSPQAFGVSGNHRVLWPRNEAGNAKRPALSRTRVRSGGDRSRRLAFRAACGVGAALGLLPFSGGARVMHGLFSAKPINPLGAISVADRFKDFPLFVGRK